MRDAYEHTDYLYDENHYIDMWLKNLGTSPVKNKSDWDEERMDTIGHNGNDGLHYQYNWVEYYPPSYTPRNDKAFLDKLVNDHWKYIEGVLDKAGIYSSELNQIEYHYKTAFAHGWRHAKEYYTGTT